MQKRVLTIEFDGVVLHGFESGPARSLLLRITGLASFVVHEEHESHCRNAASNENDDEGTKRPTPTRACQEDVDEFGTGKCSSDPRCFVDAINDHAVLERGDIGAHDIDNVEKPNVTNPVKDVATDVRLDVGANSLDDHAKNTDQEHEAETLDTTPEIDNFGHGEWSAAAECRGDDGSHGEQAVRCEFRCDIRVKAGIDVVLQHIYEADKIQPITVSRRRILGEGKPYRMNMLINVGLSQMVVIIRTRSTPLWNS